MPSQRQLQPTHIGLVSEQPLRLEGLAIIFEHPASQGNPPLIPITGTLQELLSRQTIEYMVIDLDSNSAGLALLDTVRRTRPSLKLIVLGPEGNDELVMEAIIAGARAYLDVTADDQMVRQAMDVVTSGSIWAPRRLLSKLIDRLLKVPDTALTSASTPHLTDREKQVLELILMAQSNREIARQLGIEERTVKAHVGRLMRKTGADNRVELTMRALNRTLVPRSQPKGRPGGLSHSGPAG
jgi:DNA-binding NarL/FixJ family response regulator